MKRVCLLFSSLYFIKFFLLCQVLELIFLFPLRYLGIRFLLKKAVSLCNISYLNGGHHSLQHHVELWVRCQWETCGVICFIQSPCLPSCPVPVIITVGDGPVDIIDVHCRPHSFPLNFLCPKCVILAGSKQIVF